MGHLLISGGWIGVTTHTDPNLLLTFWDIQVLLMAETFVNHGMNYSTFQLVQDFFLLIVCEGWYIEETERPSNNFEEGYRMSQKFLN